MAIWRATRAMSGRNRAVGVATDITALGARTLARVAGRTINWAGRHPYMATAGGLGAMSALGVGRGAMEVGRSMTPIPTIGKSAQSGGPGYNVWGSPRRGPMQSNNLGATGDLTLAMHKTRHR